MVWVTQNQATDGTGKDGKRLALVLLLSYTTVLAFIEMAIQLKFWGTRGSLPNTISASEMRARIANTLTRANQHDTSSPAKIDNFIDNNLPFFLGGSYGGNTPCVEILGIPDTFILCDAGSGLCQFSQWAIQHHSQPATFHIFISHLHWDHILGFPFFTQAFHSENTIIIHSLHADIEKVFRSTIQTPLFPFSFSEFKANIIFDIQSTDTPFVVNNMTVTAILQDHPGRSYSYRFDIDDKSIIYATDNRIPSSSAFQYSRLLTFYQHADVLIADAMFSRKDIAQHNQDYGHSSNTAAIDLARRAHVKHLVLFHHNYLKSDRELDAFFQDSLTYVNAPDSTLSYPTCIVDASFRLTAAYDSLMITL